MQKYLRSFRLTCAEKDITAVEQLLEAEGFAMQAEPFSPFCRRLLVEPFPLGASLAAYFGYIYIQDRSSMLPPLALNPKPGSAVLDLCASPGSKTGFLAQLVGPDGFVLANEPNSSRLASLRANMLQTNSLQVGTCSYPGEKIPLPENSLDYILLDPPCSGWGTVEKNPSVLRLWQGKKLERLIKLQQSLLRQAAKLLKPGGHLLYSTCTTNPAENCEQANWAAEELGQEPVQLEPFSGFVFADSNSIGLQIDGSASAAQGFYLSLFTKKYMAGQDYTDAVPASGRKILSSPANIYLDKNIYDLSLLPAGEIAIFANRARFLPRLSQNLLAAKFIWQGCLLGAARTNGQLQEVIPAPRWRIFINPDAPRLTFDEPEQIRALLNGRDMRCNLSTSLAVLYWRNLPLGTVSLKSGRIIARFP